MQKTDYSSSTFLLGTIIQTATSRAPTNRRYSALGIPKEFKEKPKMIERILVNNSKAEPFRVSDFNKEKICIITPVPPKINDARGNSGLLLTSEASNAESMKGKTIASNATTIKYVPHFTIFQKYHII